MPSLLDLPPDDQGATDALGELYRAVMGNRAPAPLWPADNPVGTENVGQQSVSMPRGGFDPVVDPSVARWPGRPMTQGEYDAVKGGSLGLFGQAALVAGSPAAEEGAAVGAIGRRPVPTESGQPPAPVTRLGLLGDAAETPQQTVSPFDYRPDPGRALPADNYLKPLDAHAPVMFREEAPDEVARLLSGHGMPLGRDEKFLADNPDIALGQGGNKGGIQLAFNASKIDGQVNRAKPGWDLGYQNGTAEYLGKDTTRNFRTALAGIRVPDALNLPKSTSAQVERGLSGLLSKGWTKRATDNGYTEYLPPQSE